MRRLVLLAALLLCGLAAPQALAITRDEANRIALETLKPQEATTPVILFGLPKALAPARKIAESGPRVAGRKAPKARRLGRKAWLFWLDPKPFARFQKPSTMLLVDDATGRVLRRQNLLWYPEINGKRPAFLRTPAAYRAARYRIFTNLPGDAFRPARTRTTASVGPLAVPKKTFKDDCLITIGLTKDKMFKQDFVGMHNFARRIGLRSFQAQGTRGRPTYGSDLRNNVRFLVAKEKCKDVFIYISGHGMENGVPAVTTDEKTAKGAQPVLTATTLRRILSDHPKITFKIKIDACYAGRFVPALKSKKNLLVLETSSAADEVSYSYLGRSYSTRDFEPLERTVPNPNRGEFTNGNLHGMAAFLQSATEVQQARAAGGSMLAHMIARSYELGAKADLARVGEWTHPQLFTRLPEAPAPKLSLSLQYAHKGPGRSYVCVTADATPGSTLAIELTGEGGTRLTGTLKLKEKKTATARGTFWFQISNYDRYTVKVTATKNGKSTTRTKTIEVTERPGTPACGP